MMNKLKIHADGKTLVCEFEPGAELHDILRDEVPDFAQPCGGNHTCGKCRVKLLSGEVDSAPSRHISEEEYAEMIQKIKDNL